MEYSMDFPTNYRVRFFQDNTWEVYSIEYNFQGEEYDRSHFQGNLSGCEAWIRLTEKGYM